MLIAFRDWNAINTILCSTGSLLILGLFSRCTCTKSRMLNSKIIKILLLEAAF